MSDDSSLIDAISARDATQIRDHLIAMDFYVLSIAAVDDEEQVAAMTAEVGEFEALVAFTTEDSAANFVTLRPELFGDDEGVDGVAVEGSHLLESLPEGFGLLVDPGTDETGIIDPELASQAAAL